MDVEADFACVKRVSFNSSRSLLPRLASHGAARIEAPTAASHARVQHHHQWTEAISTPDATRK